MRTATLVALLGSLVPASVQEVAAQPERRTAWPIAWPAHSFRRAVLGCDAQNADRMLAQIGEVAQCGADTAVITGHLKGYALFPSALATQASGCAVPDVLTPGVARIHELGMRAVIYVGAPFLQEALRERTDWRVRRADGQVAGDEPSVCLSSPAHAWVIDYLKEIATHAPVDGLWLDGYPQAALQCACPHCAEAYRAATGRPLPTSGSADDAGFRRYALWWQEWCVAKGRELVDALHAVGSDLAVFVNCATGRNADAFRFTPDDLCSIIDGPSLEQFWHVDHQGDALSTQFAIGMISAVSSPRQPEVFVPLLPHTVDTTTALPRVEMMARAMTCIANGAVPQTTYGPGRQDLYTELMDAIHEREPYLDSARRDRFVGIAASTKTGLLLGGSQAERDYWHEARGWFRALTEAHVPVELLCDRQLDEGDLAGLSVVVLPATGVLSDRASEAVRAFVAAGGGLVSTSVASLVDGDGALRDDFGLTDLLGATFSRVDRRGPVPMFFPILPADHPLARGEWVDEALWRQWIGLGHTIDGVGRGGASTSQPPPTVRWRGDTRAASRSSSRALSGRAALSTPASSLAAPTTRTATPTCGISYRRRASGPRDAGLSSR